MPFYDLKPSLFGRPLRGTEFDNAKINTIGIILSDGKDGPFALQIETIESYGQPAK